MKRNSNHSFTETSLVAHATPDPSSVKHRIVDHANTTFTSLAHLFEQAKIEPADLYDGDRMRIIGAFQKICKVVGIEASLRDPSESKARPLTRRDMKQI